MNDVKIIGGALFILLLTIFFPLEVSGEKSSTILIRNGTIFTVTKGVIKSGSILIKNGKIFEVGKDISVPEDAEVIDASGCVVFPGFIDSHTNLGAAEIGSLDGDEDEGTSPLTPHLRIIDAINPINSFIPLARKTGITAALTAPGQGNLLSGQSALIRLTGQNIEALVLKFPVGIHGSIGETPKLRFGKKGVLPSTRMGAAALLRQTLVDSQEYLSKILEYEKKIADKKNNDKEVAERSQALPPIDFMLDSLLPVIKGELPLIITANRKDDLLTAIRIKDEFKIRLVINQGADAYKVRDRLASENIPVLIGPQTVSPTTFETSGAVPEAAFLMQKEGVKIAFQTGGGKHFGDLLSQARLAIAHELDIEDALRALTINPAEIFGVSDFIGSLEKGKLADIVIFEGNPLLSTEAKLRVVIIGGTIVE